MNFSITDILLVILIFQLIFISVFLFTSDKGKAVSNLLFGLFFLALGLNLIDSFLLLKRVYFDHPGFALWGSNLALVFGPLLYLYFRSLVIKDFSFRKKYLLHFVPFLAFFLTALIPYHQLSYDRKVQLLESVISRKLPPYVYAISVLIYGQFLLYLFASLRLLKRYRRALGEKFSSVQQKNYTWLNYVIIYFLVFLGVGLINGFIDLTPWANYYYLILFLLIATLFGFINQVLFKAMRNPDVFAGLPEEEIREPVAAETNRKYAYSSLSQPDKEMIRHKLIDHMKKEKPFLEPELTLEQLASQLEIKPKMLSQVINESMNQNFFDFINSYRIEEAKKLLTRPKDKKITVLEVMYEVGFNSKSSFNTIFKKSTGITPSEFKKANLE